MIQLPTLQKALSKDMFDGISSPRKLWWIEHAQMMQMVKILPWSIRDQSVLHWSANAQHCCRVKWHGHFVSLFLMKAFGMWWVTLSAYYLHMKERM